MASGVVCTCVTFLKKTFTVLEQQMVSLQEILTVYLQTGHFFQVHVTVKTSQQE